MAWLDVLILVTIIINCITGFKKGLILSFFNMTKFIIAGIISKIYYPVVAEYITNDGTLSLKIKEFIGNRLNNTSYDSILNGLNLPKGVVDFLKEKSMINGVSENLYDILSLLLTNLISILFIFIVVNILLSIVGHILDKFAKFPILNTFNTLGGIVFGFIKGIIIVFIILAVFVPIVSMMPEGFLSEGLQKSILSMYLYDHNPIILIVKGEMSNGNIH